MNEAPSLQALQLADEAMPAEISTRTRNLINAIKLAQELEQQLPLLDNIKEIEERRVRTMYVADWAKRHTDPLGINGPREELYDWKQSITELYNWAVRVGMMCQRRVGQLIPQYRNNGGRPPKKSGSGADPVSVPPPKPSLKDTGLSKRYLDEARIMARRSESEMEDAFIEQSAESGKINRSAMMKKFRQEDKKHEPHNGAVTKSKEQTQISEPEPKRNSPSDKFRRYWFKEKKLLLASFETHELELIGEYWWREFNNFRLHEEKILSDSRQERKRRKALASLANP